MSYEQNYHRFIQLNNYVQKELGRNLTTAEIDLFMAISNAHKSLTEAMLKLLEEVKGK